MATTSISDLLTTKTADQLFAELLQALKDEGLPTTAWQPGSVPRTLLKADATVLADLYATARAIAAGYSLDTATGDWLTVHAKSRFDLDRIEATFAQVLVRVTCVGGAGPYNITPGALLVSDGTYRYRSTNTTTLSVPSGGYLDVTVRAEGPGTAYNAGDDTVTLLLSPALAGLSVNNPTQGSGETSLTTAARGRERDAELVTRCLARWATLGRGATQDAYLFHALNCPDADAVGVTRAKVVPDAGNGRVWVYIAQSTETASGAQVTAVQTYLDTQKPITDTVTVVAAGEVTVTVTGTVRVRNASYNTAANRTAALEAVKAYVNGLGLGEAVDLGGIYEAIRRGARGVVDVDLSSPTGDTSVAGTSIAKVKYQILSGDWSS